MKSLIFVTTVTTLLSLFNANARSIIHPDAGALTAEILSWNFQAGTSLSTERDYFGGKVLVNTLTQNIRIELQVTPACPEGMYCIQGAIFKTLSSLPIVEVTTDSCGVISYRAYKDEMPVDGLKAEIIVRDNSHAICEMYYLYQTEIEYSASFYNRTNGNVEMISASFGATDLK